MPRKNKRRNRKKGSKSLVRRSSSRIPSDNIKAMSKELGITKTHCQGHITKKKGIKFKNPALADFNELFCVIAGYKPIVSMEIGNDMLAYLRPHRNTINKIINLARKCDIYAIINKYKMFRLLIAYPKKNEERAILTQYTYVTDRGRELKTDYLSGKLLGYSEANIRHFYIKNIQNGVKQYKLDKKNFKSLVKLIKDCEEYKYFYSLSKGKAIKFPYI